MRLWKIERFANGRRSRGRKFIIRWISLTKLGLIRVGADESPAAGPERRVLKRPAAGRDRLADALESKHWVENRVHQPFLIWLALSWQARPRAFRKQFDERKKILEKRLVEERATLEDVTR